ncbi:hypothetical protein PAJL_681 [Cutibacterium acnes HL042PA3]|nr:hypothetical protein PAJL_681 [Cutibacterium acnes HL042PA3]
MAEPFVCVSWAARRRTVLPFASSMFLGVRSPIMGRGFMLARMN